MEFAAENCLLFDPLNFDVGSATLLVDHFRWGDVVIEHSLTLSPGQISIDMGTAPPEALYEMLGLLEHAGARSLRITASQAEPED